ncbi:MAG: MarR family transcriptional regulator [Actinomycetota bacterium]
MANDETEATDTAELVDILFTVMPRVADHINHRLEDLGMTTTDYWALRSVQGPMPMKDLATCMDVDPSYVTLVADRLEKLGLIERQSHPTDRRVKHLVLTAKGRRYQTSLPEKLWRGANPFAVLADAERQQLIELLQKPAACPPDGVAEP